MRTCIYHTQEETTKGDSEMDDTITETVKATERETELCNCCEDTPRHHLCGDYCAGCARPGCCAQCGSELAEWLIEEWVPGDSQNVFCEDCETKENNTSEMEDLGRRVVASAEVAGWTVVDTNLARCGSHYYRLERGDQELKVRVADHTGGGIGAMMHHSQPDISLIVGGSNDAGSCHSYADLLLRLT